MVVSHVIIDGSNLATEGRKTPSLRQLREAIADYSAEFAPELCTVVVDATFPNRIDPSEADDFQIALDNDELLTPPAGAIGRGDAFVLQIADRANAVVLSNDSFQEFHGDYRWLFDEGRLIGGKPVPGVGWVFVDRAPVRGPKSRRAVRESKQAAPKASRKSSAATDNADDDGATQPASVAKKAAGKKAAAKRAPAKKAAAKQSATRDARGHRGERRARMGARPTRPRPTIRSPAGRSLTGRSPISRSPISRSLISRRPAGRPVHGRRPISRRRNAR